MIAGRVAETLQGEIGECRTGAAVFRGELFRRAFFVGEPLRVDDFLLFIIVSNEDLKPAINVRCSALLTGEE